MVVKVVRIIGKEINKIVRVIVKWGVRIVRIIVRGISKIGKIKEFKGWIFVRENVLIVLIFDNKE